MGLRLSRRRWYWLGGARFHTPGRFFLNAAKNILAAGLAAWVGKPDACGTAVSRAKPARVKHAAATKQEPSEGLKHG